MSLKQMNVKQAQRWLDKLKNENLQSYKDITKFLRKYEKTEDEHDCYIKMSHTLLSHAQLTKQLNTYLQDPNRFVVNRPQDEKIKELMAYVKKNRPDVFEKIIQMIQDLSKSKGQNPLQISKSLKPRLREIIEGDPDLERITEEALDLTGEELINRKNLEHLKIFRHPPPIIEQKEQVSRQPTQKVQIEKQGPKTEDKIQLNRRQILKPTKQIPPFTNPEEQKNIFRQVQKLLDESTYEYILKITHIYTLGIITRNQTFDLLSNIEFGQLYGESLKDIIDNRETDRRKHSVFRPLNDMNFSNYQRASPSYVSMPNSYPIRCSGKTQFFKSLTNDKWVSVPTGSQESQNFSVRNKNSNQINLLKAEDQRYQFDIYMKRLTKAFQFLQIILDQNNPKSDEEKERLIIKVVGMGVLQLIYKNSKKEQKEEFQWFLKANFTETCKVLRDRLALQISELKGIKEIHAIKNWSEVAVKNFYKALDLKGFQFKKNQKERMKNTFFITQLQQRSKLIENGGQPKSSTISFQDKKQFFTIFNSFESSSRTQKCNSRSLPQIQSFDLKDESRRHFYPLMIMAFQDIPACEYVYSLIIFFIQSIQLGEQEKLRCKAFLQQFLVKFLGWSQPKKRALTELFDQQKLYQKISKINEEQIDISKWIEEKEEFFTTIQEQEENTKKKMKCLNDEPSAYSYLPEKSDQKCVCYGSQHLYTISRFIYSLYERLIKMREVAEDEQKLKLFQILFCSCIKTREGIKFQQNLNLLFGKHAYLFSTIYKLFDNLVKSLSNAASCALTNFSIKNYKQKSEDLYFVQLNRFCLANNLVNSKILRLTCNKSNRVLYFNYVDSYYKSQQGGGKDLMKKRVDITKGIEIYMLDSFGLNDRKKRRPNETLQKNNMEYLFEGSTIKMLNHNSDEDVLVCGSKKPIFMKSIKRQIKRVSKFTSQMN